MKKRTAALLLLAFVLVAAAAVALTRTYPDPTASHVRHMTVFQDAGVVRARIHYSIPAAEAQGEPLAGEVEVSLNASERSTLLNLINSKGIPAIRAEEGYP